MAQQIWKWSLLIGETEVEMPARSDILHVREQRGQCCIWAMVHPEDGRRLRKFHVVPTGVDVPQPATYLGTCHLASDTLIFHVFEEI